jgi:hypothetical protein
LYLIKLDEDDDEWDDMPSANLDAPAVVAASAAHGNIGFIGECVAQYNFKGTRNDELDIAFGDQIRIMEKRNDGWWKGKLNDTVGLFPSTYVKEINQ